MMNDALYRPMASSMTARKHICCGWEVVDLKDMLVVSWTEVPPEKDWGTWTIKLSEIKSCEVQSKFAAIVINDTILIPFCYVFMSEEERNQSLQGTYWLGDAMHAMFVSGGVPSHLKKWTKKTLDGKETQENK